MVICAVYLFFIGAYLSTWPAQQLLMLKPIINKPQWLVSSGFLSALINIKCFSAAFLGMYQLSVSKLDVPWYRLSSFEKRLR